MVPRRPAWVDAGGVASGCGRGYRPLLQTMITRLSSFDATEKPSQGATRVKRILSQVGPLNLLLVFVPVALAAEHLFHGGPVLVFALSCLAVIPLAGVMGHATEEIADRVGEGVGGLLNATFGNAAELIIAVMALRAGLHDLVKASITGSIIGNVLLVFGLSALAGGLRFEKQRFNKTAASLGSTLLVLSAIGLVVPAIFHMVVRGHAEERALSLEISVALIITYVLSLVFTLRTHRHLYMGDTGEDPPEERAGRAPAALTRPVVKLVVATAGVALMAELLVKAAAETATRLGWSEVFVGVILVAIIGNAAEHSTAVIMALKNRMDAAINIAVGSSIQVALFVAPVLVFLSYAVGPKPMDLLFTPLEVLSVALAVGSMALISQDGESNWMEGVQLLAVYVILGIAFFHLPV
ncbi:MAG: cax [Gemmatimonadetes bacterium]|nr:cax [Gemmatimonadota bacterium]